jgi:S-disulfanyl-L-cysteine oxidoreductase SoxD
MRSNVSKLLFALALLAIAIFVPAVWNTAPFMTAWNSLMLESRDRQNTVASRPLGIGREAKPEEIAGWDIDIRPDGQGLPPGLGSVKDGETLFVRRCAGCHGEFGEGVGRWPVLSGGNGTLANDRPVKSIGSYWPYASTIFDYVRRAQPFGNAQSLSNDETYAVVAYLLFLNDIVDEKLVLTKETFLKIKMPNEAGFDHDDRETSERAFWNPNPCTNCKADVQITGRPQLREATPAGEVPRRVAE